MIISDEFYLGKSLFYSMSGVCQIQEANGCLFVVAGRVTTQLLIGLVGKFCRA